MALSEARDKAAELHRDIRNERDPLALKREERAKAVAAAARSMTFQEAAEQYVEDRRLSWKNAKHANQ